MKEFLTAIIFVFISGATCAFGQARFQFGGALNMQPKMSVEKLIAEKENARWRAVKNKSFKEFAKNLAENYRGVYRDGFFTKTDELEAVKQLELENYTLSEMKIIFPAKDVAIITYAVEMQSRIAGQAVSVEANVSSIWLMRNGRWVAVSHTEAEIQ